MEAGIGYAHTGGRLEVVKKKTSKRLDVKHMTSMYFPAANDNVIGVIVKKNMENYHVDISKLG